MINPTTYYNSTANKAVLSAIPLSAKKILDLGCGTGNMGLALLERNIIWDGITISPSEAEIAKKHYRKVVLHNLEHGLPLDELDSTYDICLCSHVIEHIVWPQQLLHDIAATLSKPHGELIMAVPNALNHEIRFKFFRGKFDYKPSGILDSNHVRWYTFKSAQQLLNQNGFTVTRSWAEGNFPIGKKLRRKIPMTLLKKIDAFFCTLFPGFFGFQLLYCAKPDCK